MENDFLEFLAKDIEQNPSRLKPITISLVTRMTELVGDYVVNLDEKLVKEELE